MDDYNKLLLEKDQNHPEFTACDEEIEKLVAHIQEQQKRGIKVSKTASYFKPQPQEIKKVETELKQNEEALQRTSTIT